MAVLPDGSSKAYLADGSPCDLGGRQITDLARRIVNNVTAGNRASLVMFDHAMIGLRIRVPRDGRKTFTLAFSDRSIEPEMPPPEQG